MHFLFQSGSSVLDHALYICTLLFPAITRMMMAFIHIPAPCSVHETKIYDHSKLSCVYCTLLVIDEW
jgi:hypothetical protein